MTDAVEDEPSPEVVVGPYVWLLRRVGDGIRLTQAGYLPPAVVTEAADALGWRDRWTTERGATPDGRAEYKRQPGVLQLLKVAAGGGGDHDLLAQGMSILGWADGLTRLPIDECAAFFAARST